MGKLSDNVAIITGGSRGIGRAVALAFAREGARVAVTAAHDQAALKAAEREIASLGVEALASLADVSRRADIDLFVRAVVDRWEHIDILVNNAGVLNPAPLESLSEEQWDQTLSVHLKGTFNCTQAVIPYMRQRRKARLSISPRRRRCAVHWRLANDGYRMARNYLRIRHLRISGRISQPMDIQQPVDSLGAPHIPRHLNYQF